MMDSGSGGIMLFIQGQVIKTKPEGYSVIAPQYKGEYEQHQNPYHPIYLPRRQQ